MIRAIVVVLAMLASSVAPVTSAPAEAAGTRGGGHGHVPAEPGRFGGEHHQLAQWRRVRGHESDEHEFREHEFREHEFHEHEFPSPFPGPFWPPYFASPYLPPEPVCSWERGHWIDQVYVDRYGGSTHVPEWIPGHWVCR